MLPADEAIARIKASVEQTYGRRGRAVVERNFAAIDAALGALVRVEIPAQDASRAATTAVDGRRRPVTIPDDAPDFVQRVTRDAPRGRRRPAARSSALPVDGTFPTGTARYEKRAIAKEIPIWDPDICIDCGKCAIVCPHATIRMKVFTPETGRGRTRRVPAQGVPVQGPARPPPDDPGRARRLHRLRRVRRRVPGEEQDRGAPQGDQHGAGARAPRPRAPPLGLLPVDRAARPRAAAPRLGEGRRRCSSRCSSSRARARDAARRRTSSSSRQLFGDRMIVANATGCSSIYGANLPTTPWTTNADGRGPAWSNSLFEDNAEFGLGHAPRARRPGAPRARDLLAKLGPALDAGAHRARSSTPTRTTRPADRPTSATASTPLRAARAGRQRCERRRADGATPATCSRVAGNLVRQGVWIIGGDGWAYDIGFGGLDHVLSIGPQRQHARARHRGVLEHRRPGVEVDAARRGRQVRRRRQGDRQEGPRRRSRGRTATCTSRRSRWAPTTCRRRRRCSRPTRGPGPSLVIAYSTCIAHGIDMSKSMTPPEGRGEERLLAAVPVPAERDRRRPAVQARLAHAVDPGPRLRRPPRPASRSSSAPIPSRRAASPCWPRPTPTSAGGTTSSSPGMHRTVPHVPSGCDRRRHDGRRARRPTARAPTDAEALTWPDLSTPLPRPRAALADRRVGVAAHRRRRRGPRASRTPARRAIVLPSLFEEEILHEELELNRALEAGSEHFAEALDYFPGDTGVRRRRRPLPREPRGDQGARVACR